MKREDGDEQIEQEKPRRWTALDTFALVAISIGAAALRLWFLAHPDGYVFDEVYYAKDSCWYAFASLDRCDLDTPPNEVHPPLGKWAISFAIRAFGFDAFGWRLAPAIAGIATVALLYVLARRLLRSTLGATLSAGLLAVCFLHFVQSRISMLDIFVPLFGVAAFWFAVEDRDRLFSASERDGVLARPWRLAAGLAGGGALASKWSGVLILVGVVALTLVWVVRSGRNIARELPSVALYLAVLPALVYLLTYIGRVDGSLLAAPWHYESWFAGFWRHHLYMFDFHTNLEANHSYQSPAWSWLLLKRPVSYHFCSGASCDPSHPEAFYEEILATGNPFVWWAALFALVAIAVAWIAGRGPRRSEGVILAGFLVTYAPWLLLARGRSAVFVFYLLPSLPFMMLALGWVATKIGDSWEAKASIALFVAGTLALFVYYYPLLAARGIPEPQWRDRIWIFDNCDKPPPERVTTTVTKTTKGRTTTSVQETESDETLPPTGWCWI